MNAAFRRLQAQYWFWHVRNELIKQELNEVNLEVEKQERKGLQHHTKLKYEKYLKRRKKLIELIDSPLVEDIFPFNTMAERLESIESNHGLGCSWAEYASKFKRGTRSVPKHLLDRMEIKIPGSLNAHDNGPYGLFKVISSPSLAEAIWSLKQNIESAIEVNERIHSNSSAVLLLVDELSKISFQGTFSGAFSVLIGISKVIDKLFPRNSWHEFVCSFDSGDEKLETLELNELTQAKHLPIDAAAAIAISYAYIRARYFQEHFYLSKVCFEEHYLKVLNLKFLISEKRWYTGRDKQPDMSCEIKNFQGNFRRAHRIANPLYFSRLFKE